jgi:hypothetical protein
MKKVRHKRPTQTKPRILQFPDWHFACHFCPIRLLRAKNEQREKPVRVDGSEADGRV